jgi:hypothetical protein
VATDALPHYRVDDRGDEGQSRRERDYNGRRFSTYAEKGSTYDVERTKNEAEIRTKDACGHRHRSRRLIGVTAAQTAPQEKPLLSDQVFKNVQALKGIPVDEFLGTMGLMAAALQFDCSDCHVNAGTRTWTGPPTRRERSRRAGW